MDGNKFKEFCRKFDFLAAFLKEQSLNEESLAVILPRTGTGNILTRVPHVRGEWVSTIRSRRFWGVRDGVWREFPSGLMIRPQVFSEAKKPQFIIELREETPRINCTVLKMYIHNMRGLDWKSHVFFQDKEMGCVVCYAPFGKEKD